MSLLGTPLLVVLACAAVAIPVATVLLWSRVRGPRPVRGGTRLLMLGVGQLATVLLVAVLANDYGQFYTSWGGLLGASGAPPMVTTYGASTPVNGAHHGGDPGQDAHPRGSPVPRPQHRPGPATGHLQVLGNTSWSSRSQWATRGKVISVAITGYRSRLSAHAYVYLPPQYFAPAYAHRRFPAVEVMTGYPGSALNLVSRMDYPGIALNLVRAHRARPMIYVMLSSTVDPPRDTECTNVPAGPQAETFLATELTSAVEHGLRVQPGDWGVVGDSTGGYCAAKLAMLHPGLFAGGVSLSGYYHALNGGTAGDLFGGSTARKHANDLRWLLAHRPAPPARLYVTISKQETSATEGYPETMRFLRLVRPPMQVTAVIESTGGHNFATWDRELPRALSWLSHRVTHHQTGRRTPRASAPPLQAADRGGSTPTTR